MNRTTCEHFTPVDLHCDHCADDRAKATRADPIVEAVRQKLLSRSAAGMQKYGTSLSRNDLTRLDWLRHAQEEALDMANYLEVLIQKEQASWSINTERCAVSASYFWQEIDTCPAGVKVLLLTQDGVCIIGQASRESDYAAWAPLPKVPK